MSADEALLKKILCFRRIPTISFTGTASCSAEGFPKALFDNVPVQSVGAVDQWVHAGVGHRHDEEEVLYPRRH